MKSAFVLAVFLTLVLGERGSAVGQSSQWKGRIETENGVKVAKNPAEPLNGTIQLEIEKVLTINPYDQPDVGMRSLRFIRDSEGAVILFDPNEVEAHRFGHKGEYLGSFIKKGQGPGEFASGMGLSIFLMEGWIWGAGGMKLAEFDKNGQFVHEQTLKNRPSILVDRTHYLTERSEWNKDRTEQTRTLSLVRMTEESLSDILDVDMIQGIGIGTIRNKSGKGGLVDPWGTPNLCFAYDQKAHKVYAAINTEYKIFVKNMKGETLSVIEKKHENARISRKDVEAMFGKQVENDTFKWILDAYPDRLVAMNSIQPLPNGCLLVRRVSSPKKAEMDVFDGEGRYIYVLEAPKAISFDVVTFHNRGFALVDSTGEFPVYVDYRITNLPDIFGNK
jgi:hypothetical protein